MVEALETSQPKEKTYASLSVAVMLSVPRTNWLLLVQNRDQSWGLPAGSVVQGETLLRALRREIKEETQIEEDKIVFGQQGEGTGFTGAEYVDPKPHVVSLVEQGRSRIGLVFNATYHGPKLDKNGWEVSSDPEDVIYAKPFSTQELMALVDEFLERKGEKSPIYRPEFNFHQIMRWLVEKTIKDRSKGRQTKYLEKWIIKTHSRIQGFFQEVPYLYDYIPSDFSRWSYVPPYVESENKIALLRQQGYRWGP